MLTNKIKIFPFQDVVLIADLRGKTKANYPFHMRRDLEKTEEEVLEELFLAFAELNLTVHHYRDPKMLSLHASQHEHDVVFTIYGGEMSRSRLALVPAICETYGLSYVGPDAYGSIICHDKEVSKNLASQCGLLTPRHRIIRTLSDSKVIDLFPTPFVVKPLLEGSSIGISQHNLIYKQKEGIDLVKTLLHELRQPLMIEEFIPGREVSYNCFESHPDNIWSYSEVFVENNPSYFDNHLFDAEEKSCRYLPRKITTIDAELKMEDKLACDSLLKAIGKFGYCRIDGKHQDGRFIFIEITPDAFIGPTGAFAASFINKGWKYAEVIFKILVSAASSLQDQLANGLNKGDDIES